MHPAEMAMIGFTSALTGSHAIVRPGPEWLDPEFIGAWGQGYARGIIARGHAEAARHGDPDRRLCAADLFPEVQV